MNFNLEKFSEKLLDQESLTIEIDNRETEQIITRINITKVESIEVEIENCGLILLIINNEIELYFDYFSIFDLDDSILMLYHGDKQVCNINLSGDSWKDIFDEEDDNEELDDPYEEVYKLLVNFNCKKCAYLDERSFCTYGNVCVFENAAIAIKF